MKILLIGASGCFGTAFTYICKIKNVELISYSSKDLNIIDSKSISLIINKINPNIIINSASLVGINQCEEEYKSAFEINSIGPLNLIKECLKNNICYVQTSTHAVFDGKKDTPYDENDIPKPNNVYSVTKYASEKLTSSILKKYYIFRFPTLYGKRRNNLPGFVDKVEEKLLSGSELRIASDKIDSPSYNIDVAEAMLTILIEQKDYGIYHLANNGKISYYDFVLKLKNLLNSSSKILSVSDSEFKSKGFKPLKTAIKSAKIKELPNWEDALLRYVKDKYEK